jgi:hypothetical protein
MTGTVIGGTLDGRRLDVKGKSLHNFVLDNGRLYREIYSWDHIGTEYFLCIGEVQEATFS